MDTYTFVIDDGDINKRIDVFLSEEIEDLSRNSAQKLIENEKILVSQKLVKSNYKLKKNDFVVVDIPDPVSVDVLPEDIPLDILFEDKDLIVINKPQGMVVHPAAGHYTGTLVNGLLYHCKDELSGINGVMRPGIVHRIDKDTSGVLVVAKTNFAHQALSLQLKDHSMKRCYEAIVFGNIKEDEGTIDKPIGRHITERKKISTVTNSPKHAVTHFKVLERFSKYTHIEAQLETGRTHQIRVHMAYLGHPLLGDEVYSTRKQPFHLAGQVLHARELGFIHPSTQQYMEFKTALPAYFEKLIEKM